jgi:hypothetical protein
MWLLFEGSLIIMRLTDKGDAAVDAEEEQPAG